MTLQMHEISKPQSAIDPWSRAYNETFVLIAFEPSAVHRRREAIIARCLTHRLQQPGFQRKTALTSS